MPIADKANTTAPLDHNDQGTYLGRYGTMESATHAKDRDAAANVAGDLRSTKSTILETGAAMTQAGPPSLLLSIPSEI
jgi:hypothetical protein